MTTIPYLLITFTSSVTSFGDFWKFSMTNFLTQKAQIFDEVLGYLINISFKVKIDVAAF